MRAIRDLARRIEFLGASDKPEEAMDAALLRAEIERTYLTWGLLAVEGLKVDGVDATPESLLARGPENVVREALAAVRAETGLTDEARKN